MIVEINQKEVQAAVVVTEFQIMAIHDYFTKLVVEVKFGNIYQNIDLWVKETYVDNWSDNDVKEHLLLIINDPEFQIAIPRILQ